MHTTAVVIAHATDGVSVPEEIDFSMAWVCVCDGAYSAVRDAGIRVDALLGDFDSIDPPLLERVKATNELELLHRPCQMATDLEKALDEVHQRQFDCVDIINAVGGRCDQTLYNLRLLRRYKARFSTCRVWTEHEVIQVLRDERIDLYGSPGSRVSVMAWDRACVSSTGLVYEMTQHQLGGAAADSVSNALLGQHGQLTVEGIVLLMQAR